MNNIQLIGNLTKDVELRNTQSGKPVATLRLAINRVPTANNPNPGADFVNVAVWNGAAEACAKYLTKGAKVGVTGSLKTSEYDAKDGSGRRYAFEISAQRVEFLTPRNGEATPEAVSPSTEAPTDTVTEDDIPF